MKPATELFSAAVYAKRLRPLLSPDVFRPDPRHLIRIGLHVFIVGVAYLVLRTTHSWWIMLPSAVIIGHSMACLLFLAHDVSHNAVVGNRFLRRLLEMMMWGVNLIPPTLWRRVHNQTHHVETNTLADPDRVFRRTELSASAWVYNRLFFPNRNTPLRHPFVLFHFVTYIFRHVVTSLLPGDSKLSIVTAKPSYSRANKIAIITEITVILLLQLGIFCLMGGDWLRYLFAVPLPLLAASSVAMAYIFTNHFLNPLCEHSDPLIGSTSVIVPRWIDWLHDNFSYHTEHHVFPGMNPRYFPEVSSLLAEHFPDRYQRIPFREAWRRLWLAEEFITEGSAQSPET